MLAEENKTTELAEEKVTKSVTEKKVVKKTKEKALKRTLMWILIEINNELSTTDFQQTGKHAKGYAYFTISDKLSKILEVCLKHNVGFDFSDFNVEKQITRDEDKNEIFKVAMMSAGEKGAMIASGSIRYTIMDMETLEKEDGTIYCSAINYGDKAQQVLLTVLKKMFLELKFYGAVKGIKEEEDYKGDISFKQMKKQPTKKTSEDIFASSPNTPKTVTFDKKENKVTTNTKEIFNQETKAETPIPQKVEMKVETITPQKEEVEKETPTNNQENEPMRDVKDIFGDM